MCERDKNSTKSRKQPTATNGSSNQRENASLRGVFQLAPKQIVLVQCHIYQIPKYIKENKLKTK